MPHTNELRRPTYSLRLLTLLLVLGCWVMLVAQPARADVPRVYAFHLQGVISQLTADQVIELLRKAEQDGASAVLIQIDSPGGPEAPVRQITHEILASTLPVIVFVGEEAEAQALSGGMLITMAGHIAAMAPNTRIGSTIPPGLTDRAEQADREARLEQALQAALSVAEIRDRDVETVTEVVRNEEILQPSQALQGGLIDVISPSIPSLLETVNGREVDTLLGSLTLQTLNARVIWDTDSWRERALDTINDPNVAYVLFTVGVTLVIIELYNPGKLVAGVPGVIALIAAFIAFGNLPVSWLGLGLLVLAVILFIRELYTPNVGLLGPLGVLAYAAGSFMLYRPVRQSEAIAPSLAVNPWIIAISIAAMVAVLLTVMRAVFRVRRDVLPTDLVELKGAEAIVIQALDPRGVVRVHGQEWSAVSDEGSIDEGRHVRVARVEAGVLHVVLDEPSRPAGRPLEWRTGVDDAH